jgi:hypothetical protein
MGRTKGSKNKSKDVEAQPSVPAQVLTGHSAVMDELEDIADEASDEGEGSDAVDPNSHVIPVNSDKTYGIISDRYCFAVYTRELFREDKTFIQTKGRGAGRTVVQKAGEYSNWRLSAHPYQNSISAALETIAKFMIEDGLSDHRDISILADFVSEVLDEIKAFGKTLKLNG